MQRLIESILGIHLAIKHFRYYLEGRNYTVYTDHKPILAALHKTTEPVSGRQARQLAAIAEATTDVRHVDGKDNMVADALSRIEAPEANDQPDEPGFICHPFPVAASGPVTRSSPTVSGSSASGRLEDWSRDQLVNAVLGQKPGLCFFHARFGSKAKKCESPCQWTGPDGRKWTNRKPGSGSGNSQPGQGRSQ